MEDGCRWCIRVDPDKPRRVQVWDAHAALAFLSMCRAYKPLLAAQRQQATLVGILDYLQPLVRQCSTPQLSTLLLDLAFIGCQSFKSHPLLTEVSMELYSRVQAGSLNSDDAVELADAIRALDKLDHCYDALSRAAGATRACVPEGTGSRAEANTVPDPPPWTGKSEECRSWLVAALFDHHLHQ